MASDDKYMANEMVGPWSSDEPYIKGLHKVNMIIGLHAFPVSQCQLSDAHCI